MSGQAASYYNPGQSFAEGQQPGGHPQQPRPMQQQLVYGDGQGQYQGYQGQDQAPPDAKPPQEPPAYDQAIGFDEAFRIEKPRFNDLWAGLLVGAWTE